MGSAGRACASYTILSTLLFGVSLIGSAASPAATLEEAVRQSLSTSPDTLIDVQERLARDQALRQARGGYLPDVDLRAAYGREGSDNVITRAAGNADNVWLTRQEAELSLRQMLFDGFATRSEVERQTARVSSSAYRVQASFENTALRTTEVYLEVLKRREAPRGRPPMTRGLAKSPQWPICSAAAAPSRCTASASRESPGTASGPTRIWVA